MASEPLEVAQGRLSGGEMCRKDEHDRIVFGTYTVPDNIRSSRVLDGFCTDVFVELATDRRKP